MKRKSTGGFAKDLLSTADPDVEPVIDWGQLAAAIARRDMRGSKAIAGRNIAARALVARCLRN